MGVATALPPDAPSSTLMVKMRTDQLDASPFVARRRRGVRDAPMIASRVVAADAELLRLIVAEPAGQWRIVSGIHPGLRPSAHADPCLNAGMVPVRVGLWGRDVVWACWLLVPGRGTTEVGLVAQFESSRLLGRVLPHVGVRGWIQRRLEATLSVLAALAYRAAEDLTTSSTKPTSQKAAPVPPASMARAPDGGSHEPHARALVFFPGWLCK